MEDLRSIDISYMSYFSCQYFLLKIKPESGKENLIGLLKTVLSTCLAVIMKIINVGYLSILTNMIHL